MRIIQRKSVSNTKSKYKQPNPPFRRRDYFMSGGILVSGALCRHAFSPGTVCLLHVFSMTTEGLSLAQIPPRFSYSSDVKTVSTRLLLWSVHTWAMRRRPAYGGRRRCDQAPVATRPFDLDNAFVMRRALLSRCRSVNSGRVQIRSSVSSVGSVGVCECVCVCARLCVHDHVPIFPIVSSHFIRA